MSVKGFDEQSLIDDASTLLLFSKARSGSGGGGINTDGSGVKSLSSSPKEAPVEGSQSVVRSTPLSRTSTERGTLSPRNPMGSVGPASAALLQDDGFECHRSGSMSPKSSDGSGNSNSKQKGMVAAAALAAAATVPLPLNTERRRKSKHEVERIVETGSKNLRHEWPVPDSFVVDIDSGVISCICGYDDDDGFTIQCDHCHRWQHAICYNIKDIETAPEDHLCNTCEPRRLDPKKARRRQLERRQALGSRNNRDAGTAGGGGSKDDAGAGGLGKDSDNNELHSEAVSNEGKNSETETGYDKISRRGSYASDVQNNVSSTENAGRKRKNDGETGQMDDAKRRKDNISYTSAKEAYSAMFLPIDRYEFKDKYAKLFIEKHNDDDWVIPYNKKVFEPLSVEVKPYAEVNNSKVFPGYSKLGVYLKEFCHQKSFICEFLGEVDFQRGYLMDPRNHYRIWGTTKPKVLFHPHWPLYIDARLCGNLARYMRRSCNPNVELATAKMPDTNEVKFVLRAIRDIQEGEEIHIGWQWDLRHPIWQLINKTATFESLNDPDKYLLIHSIDTVLGACECACGNNNKECNLLKVKKFSQSLYRSVKSKMNNRYKLNEILNQYQGKRRRQPPILKRLANERLQNSERASELIAEYDEKKAKCLSNATYDGVVVAESLPTGETIKPYKWVLMNKYHGSRNGVFEGSPASSFNKAPTPLTFDEQKVTDLNKLPIPIVLEIPIESPSMKGKLQIDYSNKAAAEVPSKEKPPVPSISATGKTIDPVRTETKSGSASANTLPDLADAYKNPLKKKLSFADYRKKQHK
ncbi:hypothetical protein HG536_0F01360 [Torulaspora globosa]|uniref:SET domain-containing protein n=1 Tax=Torulaspora globosa TaxID=48254 RepID=A0A7G3ZJX5_9SACH|nr:uncharacterized protein HG536_0F01360 [Torulaspora globosa]QLL33811.1 hypothetical protein HG536_0F01360 [Torulaspora globosa]